MTEATDLATIGDAKLLKLRFCATLIHLAAIRRCKCVVSPGHSPLQARQLYRNEFCRCRLKKVTRPEPRCSANKPRCHSSDFRRFCRAASWPPWRSRIAWRRLRHWHRRPRIECVAMPNLGLAGFGGWWWRGGSLAALANIPVGMVVTWIRSRPRLPRWCCCCFWRLLSGCSCGNVPKVVDVVASPTRVHVSRRRNTDAWHEVELVVVWHVLATSGLGRLITAANALLLPHIATRARARRGG